MYLPSLWADYNNVFAGKRREALSENNKAKL